MGSYIKYFSIVTVLLIFIAAFAVGKYVRVITEKNVILPIIQTNNGYFAQQYHKTIWPRYMEDKSINAEQFLTQTIGYFNQLPMIRVIVANPTGKRYMSTTKYDFSYYEKQGPIQEIYDQVGDGKVFARIISPIGFRDQKGIFTKKGSLIQTVYPIASEGKVIAVIDMYYNVTLIWDYLDYFQMAVTGGILIIGVFIYVLIFVKSYKASKIINRQQEANQELIDAKVLAEEQNQEKSKFLANISHELRTPLNAIIGFSEIMKDEQFGPLGNEQYRDYCRDINASGVHLLSLINDILDFSKADANKLEMDMIEVDLTKLIKTTIRLVLPRAQDAKVELVENIPKQHIILRADQKRLKQVILNLLSNAVKFTPEGGTVSTVVWPNDNGRVTIEVKDTGIGIAPKDIAKAMSTFGQVDSKLSRRYEGTGLGLPLSKKLVELMDGTFEIKSEINLGTTVTITFPIPKANGAIADAAPPAAPPAAPTTPDVPAAQPQEQTQEAPKPEEPESEAPKVEEPKVEEPKTEEPKS